MRIRIRSDIPLGRGGEGEVLFFLRLRRRIDLEDGFRSGDDPERLQVTEVLVTDRPPDGVSARPADLDSHFMSLIPRGGFLLLRDQQGDLHDYRDCKQFRATRRVDGILFQDAFGTVWSFDPFKTEDNLKPVFLFQETAVEAGLGPLLEKLPISSDYEVTDDDPARVGHVYCWERFGSDPETGARAPYDDADLADLLSRAHSLRASYPTLPEALIARTAHPDPGEVPDP